MAENEVRWSNVNGVLRMIDENGNETVVSDKSPTWQEERQYQQEMHRADQATEADVEAYEELKWSDPNFEAVREKMAELAELADPEDAARINKNHRVFLENFHEVKNLLVGQAVDRPRTDAIARLRQQLREEDEKTGGRATARRGELEQRILSLHGPGR